MSAVVLSLMAIAMYANPVLLFFAWFRRLRSQSQRDFRSSLGWVSLVLCTVAFLAFVLAVGVCPTPATPLFDIWFRRWFWIICGVSACGLITGLLGKGKMQWIVPISALASPISIVMMKVLE